MKKNLKKAEWLKNFGYEFEDLIFLSGNKKLLYWYEITITPSFPEVQICISFIG